jgi:REP element-mobilizing transposase RayT
MTRARQHQVCVASTPYYHCISRCVRRAFLCGRDRFSGKSFDHRKEWLVVRMRELAGVFAIDVAAYAVMSNHFHLVVRLAPERVEGWDDEELLDRLEVVFKPTARLIRTLSARARKRALAPWRARLADLSWFMRCLNESIARRANREDGCTGRFWEGRFKTQALLDEGALITCMSYVDLNPVRAGLARKLENAELTSIRERLLEAAGRAGERKRTKGTVAKAGAARRSAASAAPTRPQAPLVPFATATDVLDRARKTASRKKPTRAAAPVRTPTLPMTLATYVELLEQVGTALRTDNKSGALSPAATSALVRLGIAPDHFVTTLRGYTKSFFTMVGHTHAIDAERERLGMQRVKGSRAAGRMYAAA